MKRVMLQTYVRGAAAAIQLYQQAFGARLLEIHHTPEGKVFHSELEVYGQILAVADREDADGIDNNTGNIMQFCLHFAEGEEAAVEQAYKVLAPTGKVLVPLGPCGYSACMTDLIDCYGVRWCIFTA